MALVSRADVKTYLGIGSTDDDDLLDDLIASAESIVSEFTHRTFDATSSTKKFDAEADVEGATLYFSGGFELAGEPSAVSNGDGTALVADTDYVMVPLNRFPAYGLQMLPSSSSYWQGKSNGDHVNAISVTGSWGYSTSAPNDVVQAAKRLSAYLYRQRDTNADTDRPLIVDGVTILPSSLPRDVERMLSPYVLRTI
jgi:hypothetical protein